jgi:hypothetical protein
MKVAYFFLKETHLYLDKNKFDKFFSLNSKNSSQKKITCQSTLFVRVIVYILDNWTHVLLNLLTK